jgi:hypothetical protein
MLTTITSPESAAILKKPFWFEYEFLPFVVFEILALLIGK